MNAPTPVTGRLETRYHESSSLRSPRDSDAVPRVWQRGLSVARQVARLANAVEELFRLVNRLRMYRGGEDAVALGVLMHYDPEESWTPGQRVVVYPTDELVTTGILDEETDVLRKAPAGIYCCIKAASPIPIDPEDPEAGSTYNPPKWPTETADDLEAVNTYWWLESLYPTLVMKCVENPEGGEDMIETEYYENTQPVPPPEE